MGLSDAGIAKYTLGLTTSASTSSGFKMRRTARIGNKSGAQIVVSFYEANNLSATKTTWDAGDAADLTIPNGESKAIPSSLEACDYVVLTVASGTPTVTVVTKD